MGGLAFGEVCSGELQQTPVAISVTARFVKQRGKSAE
jgi:hypothetical protein